MANPVAGFRADVKGRAAKAHARAAREGMRKPKLETLRSRARRIETKLDNHLTKHTPRWVKAEEKRLEVKLAAKRSLGRQDGPKPPPGAITQTEAKHLTIQRQARINVRARCEAKRQAVTRAELNLARTRGNTPETSRDRSQDQRRTR